MSQQELESEPSPLQKLLDYHRLLRIVEEECHGELNDDATAHLVALIISRIQQFELPAALELDRANQARGCKI